ncbi:hypothetical protein [Nocardia salmonicida]|uniref:hypothetical protein n=1 Tax=Nocardia salmonicida TaxID=53431 RepID=UPI00340A397F
MFFVAVDGFDVARPKACIVRLAECSSGTLFARPISDSSTSRKPEDERFRQGCTNRAEKGCTTEASASLFRHDLIESGHRVRKKSCSVEELSTRAS